MASFEDITTVRALIADEETPPLLSDPRIEAFLSIAGGSLLLGAALALEAIAVSEVLVSKKIRAQDLSTDGPAVSAELRALAASYRGQAKAAADAEDTWDGFDIVDTLPHCGRDHPELTPRPVVTGL